jgi:ATP-dependent Clp protease ATP-binding subunit ClpC
MELANQEAQRLSHEFVGTEHVLFGLIEEGTAISAVVLKNFGVDSQKVRLELKKLAPSALDDSSGKLPMTRETKIVIEHAIEESDSLKHLKIHYIDPEYILLGLLREREGTAAQVLLNLGLKLEDVREEVLNLLSRGGEG